MVFHKQRGTAVAASASVCYWRGSDINGRRHPAAHILDGWWILRRLPNFACPSDGRIIKISKGQERRAGCLSASRAVAKSNGRGKDGALVRALATSTAAAENWRLRRVVLLRRRFHGEVNQGARYSLRGLQCTADGPGLAIALSPLSIPVACPR